MLWILTLDFNTSSRFAPMRRTKKTPTKQNQGRLRQSVIRKHILMYSKTIFIHFGILLFTFVGYFIITLFFNKKLRVVGIGAVGVVFVRKNF